jgi:hypothetical protein
MGRGGGGGGGGGDHRNGPPPADCIVVMLGTGQKNYGELVQRRIILEARMSTLIRHRNQMPLPKIGSGQKIKTFVWVYLGINPGTCTVYIMCKIVKCQKVKMFVFLFSKIHLSLI